MTIRSALRLLLVKEYESALSLIFSAIDATGMKKYPNDYSSARSKKFIKLNQGLITKIAMDTELTGNINFDIIGMYTEFSEILYHLVRCNLIHEAKFHIAVSFDDNDNGMELDKGITKSLKKSEVIEKYPEIENVLELFFNNPEENLLQTKRNIKKEYFYIFRNNDKRNEFIEYLIIALDQKIKLSSRFVWGMFLTVIASKENIDEKIEGDQANARFNNKLFNINELWGQEEKIRNLL